MSDGDRQREVGPGVDGPVLAIDTATDDASVAVCDASSLLAERRWTSVRRQTVGLAPNVRDALAFAGVALSDLVAIAVAIGPGSYTGLRVGLAFAKGLSLVDGTLIIGVPTLDGLARSLTRPHTDRDDVLIAVLRAGRGRLIGMHYAADAMPAGDRRREIEGLSALPLERIAAAAPPGAWFAGELDHTERDWLTARGFHAVDPEHGRRRAQWLAEHAREHLEAGDLGDAAALAPIYPGGRARPGPRSPDVSLRPMVAADIPAVTALLAAAFPVSRTEQAISSEFDRANVVWMVAQHDDTERTIAGVGAFWMLHDEAHVTTLAVRPERRRAGIGARLVRELTEHAEAAGARTLILEVRAGDQEARAFYTALGFAEIGRRADYYPPRGRDAGDDAIVLQRALEADADGGIVPGMFSETPSTESEERRE